MDGGRLATHSEMIWESTCQDDSCLGTQCGDGRCARSNPPEQTSETVPPGAEGGERWELEAYPRHVEILVSQMPLGDESKTVSSAPGVRLSDEDDGKECVAEGRACNRSWTMRASYLSPDRCELQFAVKELARRMEQPNAKNMQALKRLVRFLNPWCLVVYGRQS